MSELVFSGVQPTGNLHLGNYLGAIKNWVELDKRVQGVAQSIFCIVDLHAITVPQEPKALYESTLETAAAFIACGVDHKKSIIFPQSAVSAHSELAWILSCNTPMGWLNRMTQFKDKAGKNKEKAALGLYSYPVLMAADILLYKTTIVPVGDDQKQHLELARDIAISFNSKYGKEVFKVPEPLIFGQATRVMSLRDGKKKMSKSDESDASRINLFDDADTIRRKLQKAKSDSDIGITYDEEKRPEISNLLRILASAKSAPLVEVEAIHKDNSTSSFKMVVAEALIDTLAPISKKFNELKGDKGELQRILRDGSEKANEIAEKNMKEIKETVGFFV